MRPAHIFKGKAIDCDAFYLDVPGRWSEPLCQYMLHGRYCPYKTTEEARACSMYHPKPTKEELEAWIQKIRAKNAAMEKSE